MTCFTKKAILSAFQDLLQEKSFDKITVSAVVARCGISPNTFYYHFSDIYDLLDQWLEAQAASLRAQTIDMPALSQKLKFILHTLQEHPSLVYHISDSLSRERLERYVFTSLEKQFYDYVVLATAELPVTEEMRRMLAGFFCYSLLGFILRFLWMKMDADIDSSVDALEQLFQATLASYISNPQVLLSKPLF